ncbi:MAG: bifunctional folylpolyglutamate synthase/dihydrofolate synthase [Phycisphaerae bacterium]|nr:bifunctional folylpolyglutamate synthase/dihydrofolate synthase [Phycisphaerae bacterium]
MRTPGHDKGSVDPPNDHAAPARKGARSLHSYDEAVAWLGEQTNVERSRPENLGADVFKLERMHALAEALGHPERSFKSVHVAGSKGKGSVCEMTASCLEACGYTTGLYTSPHLVDMRERVRINQRRIEPGDFLDLLKRVAGAADAVARKHGHATFFELVTALAFCHFAEQAVDVAVIEVGLGGRLDATNVIRPEVAALAAIQLEHTQLLGGTLELIAREKAGIMKPGVPCVTFPQSDAGVNEVFRQTAEATRCPLITLGKDVEFTHRFEATPDLGPHVRVSLSSPRSAYEHLPVPLKGLHQAHNCGLALAILDQLRARGLAAPERQVAQGLARTPNHGRMEVVSRAPMVMIDGAHNPESVYNLIQAVGAYVKPDSTVVIFGCAADKDVPRMLQKLARGADKIIFTRSAGSGRAAEPKDLQRRFAELTGKQMQCAPGVAEALRIAQSAAHRDDLILVTGSFYVAGEAKRLFAPKAGAAVIEPRPAGRHAARP